MIEQIEKPLDELEDWELQYKIAELRSILFDIGEYADVWWIDYSEYITKGIPPSGITLHFDSKHDAIKYILTHRVPNWPKNIHVAIDLLAEMPDFTLKWYPFFKQWYVTDPTGYEVLADTPARAISLAWLAWKLDTQKS